jgi:hypothetical protein
MGIEEALNVLRTYRKYIETTPDQSSIVERIAEHLRDLLD